MDLKSEKILQAMEKRKEPFVALRYKISSQEEDFVYKKLYVCLTEQVLQWYRIDPIPTSKRSGTLVPVGSQTIDSDATTCASGFSFIGCDSKLYAFGGGGADQHFYGNKEIMVFDPKSVDSNNNNQAFPWKKLDHKLLQNRFAPAVVVKDSKIYIFGSFMVCGTPMPHPWGEVYDTKLGTIESLPEPPAELMYNTWNLGDAAVYKNQILIECEHHIYSYDLDRTEWEDIIHLHPDIPHLSNGTVTEHGFLITFCHGLISAYDLDHKICIQPIPGFEDVLTNTDISEASEGYLTDLGNGKLCVIWSVPKNCCTSYDYVNVVTFELIIRVSDVGSPDLFARIFTIVKNAVPAPPSIDGFVSL